MPGEVEWVSGWVLVWGVGCEGWRQRSWKRCGTVVHPDKGVLVLLVYKRGSLSCDILSRAIRRALTCRLSRRYCGRINVFVTPYRVRVVCKAVYGRVFVCRMCAQACFVRAISEVCAIV